MKKRNPLVASWLYLTKLNSNFDSFVYQVDMPSYDKLSHAFNEINNDMPSLCMKNEALKKFSSLSKEIETLKD